MGNVVCLHTRYVLTSWGGKVLLFLKTYFLITPLPLYIPHLVFAKGYRAITHLHYLLLKRMKEEKTPSCLPFKTSHLLFNTLYK